MTSLTLSYILLNNILKLRKIPVIPSFTSFTGLNSSNANFTNSGIHVIKTMTILPTLRNDSTIVRTGSTIGNKTRSNNNFAISVAAINI